MIAFEKERLAEIQKSLKSESYLSVVKVCGSVLEDFLSGMEIKNMKEFNHSPLRLRIV